MSFILDALKKSEQKRRNQADQEPRTIFDPSVSKSPRSRIWLIILVFFLLLNVLLLAWLTTLWLRPPSSARVKEVSPSIEVVVPVDRPESNQQISGEFDDVDDAATPATRNLLPVSRPSAVGEQVPIVSQSQPQAEVPPTFPAEPPPPAEVDPLYSLSELPAAVRGRLPSLQMALHAFNTGDAGASLVQINGRAVREGASVGENLTLEEITAEGAIIRFGRYRFLLPRRGQ